MAAQTKGKGKSWPKVGTLRKNDKGSYIKLEPNVEIYVDGIKIDMNDGRIVRLDDPRKKVESLLAGGHISEEDAGKRLEKLSELTWLRYELYCAPNRA